jgi:cell division septation protein DedD
MKSRALAATVVLTIFVMLFGGCGSSQDTSDDFGKTAQPPVTTTNAQPAAKDSTTQQAPAPAQTAPAPQPQSQPQTQAPAQTTPAPPPSNGLTPSGAFSVQVGAFSMSDKADQIAQAARTRFPDKTVYEVKDPTTSLVKVLVGDFNVKEDARAFRDQIIQQFGDDYKGAWVYNVSGH